jgi:hypothetical protein
MKRRRFILRRPGRSEHFRRAGLVKAHLPSRAGVLAQRFEQAQGAGTHHVGCILGLVEADAHVGLRRQVVDLVGLGLLEDVAQPGPVGDIAVVQKQRHALLVRVGVDGSRRSVLK